MAQIKGMVPDNFISADSGIELSTVRRNPDFRELEILYKSIRDRAQNGKTDTYVKNSYDANVRILKLSGYKLEESNKMDSFTTHLISWGE